MRRLGLSQGKGFKDRIRIKEIFSDIYDPKQITRGMDNDWKKRLGVVYSSDPAFEYESDREKTIETPEPGLQKLYVSLDKKNRKGKVVTLVEGFIGDEEDLKELGKELKSKCGSGGTAKEGEILVQGDFRDRVMKILRDKGYPVKQKGG